MLLPRFRFGVAGAIVVEGSTSVLLFCGLGSNLPTEGKILGRHTSPKTTHAAVPETTVPRLGIELEILRCGSKSTVLLISSSFGVRPSGPFASRRFLPCPQVTQLEITDPTIRVVVPSPSFLGPALTRRYPLLDRLHRIVLCRSSLIC
jgi:hypothetical protein